MPAAWSAEVLLLLLGLAVAAPAPTAGESPTEQARWLMDRWTDTVELEARPTAGRRDPVLLEWAWLELEIQLAETRWRGEPLTVRLLGDASANARIAARAKAAELLAGRDQLSITGPRQGSEARAAWRLATRLHAWTWRHPTPAAAPILLELELTNLESDLELPRRCWPRDARPAESLLVEARAALAGGDAVVQGALTVILVEAHRPVKRTRCPAALGPVEAPPPPAVEVPAPPAPLVAWRATLAAHLESAAAAPAQGGEALEAATRALLVWPLPPDLAPDLAEAARWEAVLDGAERSWRAWGAAGSALETGRASAGQARCAALMAYALDELRGTPPRIYP